MEFMPKIEILSDSEHDEDQDQKDQKGKMSNHDLRLYLIRRTLLQMLRDRGYQIGDMEIAMSREDFCEKFGTNIPRHQLDLSKVKRDDPTEQVNTRRTEAM
jgi:hypothetical protein